MRLTLSAFAAVAVLFISGCSSPPATTTTTTPPPVAMEHGGVLLSYTGNNQTVATPPALSSLAVAHRPTYHRGGEPNIGITKDGAIFVTAGPGVEKSTDLGKTWTEVFNLTTFWGPAYNPEPTGTVYGLERSSDDMLWVDVDTGRVFADFMTGLECSKLFYSDDAGTTWTPSPFDCGVPVNDHQKLATGHYGPTLAPAVNPIYPNLVYYCYNKLAASSCAVSHDGGLTFNYDRAATIATTPGSDQPTTFQGPCGGINGHPAAAPDGTLYLPLNLGCPAPVVAVSTDNGLTYVNRVGPAIHGAEELDPDITVTPDGTAYMLYRGTDHLQYLVRSHDRFATFEGPWQVSPPSLRSTVFAGITSGDNGRIAMAYLGTRDSSKESSVAENATHWYLFETVSLDAGNATPTFTTVQTSADIDPVQIGCVWLNGGGNPCRNMLDFIDMVRDPDGRPVVVFSDGCTVKCDGNATATNLQSRNRTITIAVMDSGPSLLADKGSLMPK